MVTNYPEQIAAEIGGRLATIEAARDRVLRGLWTRVRHFLCSLHGHDSLLHFEDNRMFLRCESCGYETPGWEIDASAPQLRFCGDPRRHHLASVNDRKERELPQSRRIA